MTGYQAPGAPMQQYQKPPKGWFARNWWWFLALVIFGPFICCCGTCGGCAYWTLNQVEEMPPYKDTVSAAMSNAEVQAELGQPIEVAGMWDTMTSGGQFDMKQSTTGSTLTASIPITGPNGSGTLYIDATDNGSGVWTYSRREVIISGSGVVIDLIPAGSGLPGINLPDLTDPDETDPDGNEGDGTE